MRPRRWGPVVYTRTVPVMFILRPSKVGIWSYFAYSFFLPDPVSYFTTINWLTLSMKLRTFIPPLRSKQCLFSRWALLSYTFPLHFGVSWNVIISISASWSVGELVCRRVVHKPRMDCLFGNWKHTESTVNSWVGSLSGWRTDAKEFALEVSYQTGQRYWVVCRKAQC